MKAGCLVRFITTETGVDTVFPVGLPTRHLVGRLSKTGNYEPRPDEIGLVVGGPADASNKIQPMWEVFVGEKKWWFLESDLLMVNNDI